jgi:hypothetical protein
MRFLRRLFGPSRKAIERLREMGYPVDPTALRKLVQLWQFGDKEFWWHIEQDQWERKQITEQLPILEEFAAECRRHRPAPGPSEFSAAQREQGRIIAELSADLLREPPDDWPLLCGSPHIFATSLVGIAVLAPAVRRVSYPVVLLTPDERRDWFAGPGKSDPEDFWWYVLCDCDVVEFPDSQPDELVRPGETRWVVEKGSSVGDLGGEWTKTVWAWDGKRAEPRGEPMWTIS